MSRRSFRRVDSYGLPVHFELSVGQENDIVHAESLITQSPPSEYVIADKGYDSEKFRDFIRKRGATSVIPYRKNSRKSDQSIDRHLYSIGIWLKMLLPELNIFEQ